MLKDVRLCSYTRVGFGIQKQHVKDTEKCNRVFDDLKATINIWKKYASNGFKRSPNNPMIVPSQRHIETSQNRS